MLYINEKGGIAYKKVGPETRGERRCITMVPIYWRGGHIVCRPDGKIGGKEYPCIPESRIKKMKESESFVWIPDEEYIGFIERGADFLSVLPECIHFVSR